MSDAVVLALIATAGSIASALITAFVYIKLGRVETKVDGKMDALLAASIGKASAEGRADGVLAEQSRTAEPQK